MGKLIQFKSSDDEKLYGECPGCLSDEFHVLMDIDECVMGVECWSCRAEYIFEGTCLTVELEE